MLEQKVFKFIQEHNLIEEGDRVLAGVSGGPDSLCLLHLLYSLAKRLKISLAVAHLNHGMRPEAGREAEMVRDLAASWSLPFFEETVNVPAFAAGRGLSEEEAGRILRYRFLSRAARQCSANKIAVGHHRDDQVETVLFNLLRGTGPDGLAGILPDRALGTARLIRPLLCLTRREIELYCRDKQLHPALDSSNLQIGYTRNRIRLELIPHLEKTYNPRVREALARLAALAAADRRYLQAQAARALKAVARRQDHSLVIKKATLNLLPQALRGRVARMALQELLQGRQLEWNHVHALLALAREEGPDREIPLPGGMVAYSSRGSLVVTARRPAARVLTGSLPLPVPGRTLLPGGGFIEARICSPAELNWPPAPHLAYLDYHLLPLPLAVRPRWPGARFHPQGAPGGKKLKDFFIDRKIARLRRDCYPLVVSARGEIVWVAGLRIAHPYRVTGQTEKVLLLNWQERTTVSENSKEAVKAASRPEREGGDMPVSEELDVLLSRDQIAQRVAELAGEISHDYRDQSLLVVNILKGAAIFGSDLVRQLKIPVEIDYMAASSYGSATASSGAVRILKDLEQDIQGKDVLIVEDIVDTGLTLNYLRENLISRRPRSLKVVTLLDKPSRRKVAFDPDYCGFTIPDCFVVGYGLDFDEKYRNLPDICVLNQKGE